MRSAFKLLALFLVFGVAFACDGDHCNWKETRKSCKHMANYMCTDSKSFCLGGHVMACAPGTWCKDSAGPWITPCSLTKPPHKHRKHMTKRRWAKKQRKHHYSHHH